VPSKLATLQTLEVLLIIRVMRSIYSYTVRNKDSILLPKDTFQLLGNNPIMKQDVHQSTTCINIGIINALRYWVADCVIFLTTFFDILFQ
jgi:hypothetical protein